MSWAAANAWASGFSMGGLNTKNGLQGTARRNFQFYAMAVRPGDVRDATVPEPDTLVLALAALAALAGRGLHASHACAGGPGCGPGKQALLDLDALGPGLVHR